jgi:hypothetical protein
MIVVIPTARAIRLDYIEALIAYGARVVVVNDTAAPVAVDHPQVEVLGLDDRERLLGSRAIAIPHGTGSCRDLGFYVAWRDAGDDDIIVALDDDCWVQDESFVADLVAAMSPAQRPVAVGEGRHFNCLDVYAGVDDDLFPRGFPYSARLGYRPWQIGRNGTDPRAPAMNLGLWRNVFDVNAIDKVRGPRYVYPEAELSSDGVAVPSGALVSVCSMNMHFRRDVIPALYQLPMNLEVMPGHTIDRYGDIWGGFILKTLMDVRGDLMTVGGPLTFHVKEGDYVRNIHQEHLAHLINDEFVDLLFAMRESLVPASYLEMMAQVLEELRRARATCSPILGSYLRHLDAPLSAWIGALEVC